MATVEIIKGIRPEMKIAAIKLVREATGLGLYEAKCVVEAAGVHGAAATLTVASAEAARVFAGRMSELGYPCRVAGGAGPPASPNL